MVSLCMGHSVQSRALGGKVTQPPPPPGGAEQGCRPPLVHPAASPGICHMPGTRVSCWGGGDEAGGRPRVLPAALEKSHAQDSPL